MKVLACTETFKGTLEAEEVGTQCLQTIKGLLDGQGGLGEERAAPSSDFVNLPLTDGGAGFLAAMGKAMPSLKVNHLPVHGPNPTLQTVSASYGAVVSSSLSMEGGGGGKTSYKALVFEMASACGLPYIPTEADRHPLLATSVGVGELIRGALLLEASRTEEPPVRCIYIGLGGTATNDGAIPALVALGALEVEVGGQPWEASSPLQGCHLRDITRVVLKRHILETLCGGGVEVVLVTDVNNTLLGPQGATEVFGPQKGATTPEIRAVLEEGLRHCAQLVEEELAKAEISKSTAESSKVGQSIVDMPGGGAAGGAGCFLSTVLANATIKPGAQAFAEIVGLRAQVQMADLVVTGEGSFDSQTLENGKTIDNVRAACLELGKPLLVVCGRNLIPEAEWRKDGYSTIVSVVPLTPKFSVEKAMTETADCLHHAIVDAWPEIYKRLGEP